MKCILRFNVASKLGLILKRWAQDLTVTLEQMEVNIRVDKLRVMLLIEADLNQKNKLMFKNRLIKQLEANNYIPDEACVSRASLNVIWVAVKRIGD